MEEEKREKGVEERKEGQREPVLEVRELESRVESLKETLREVERQNLDLLKQIEEKEEKLREMRKVKKESEVERERREEERRRMELELKELGVKLEEKREKEKHFLSHSKLVTDENNLLKKKLEELSKRNEELEARMESKEEIDNSKKKILIEKTKQMLEKKDGEKEESSKGRLEGIEDAHDMVHLLSIQTLQLENEKAQLEQFSSSLSKQNTLLLSQLKEQSLLLNQTKLQLLHFQQQQQTFSSDTFEENDSSSSTLQTSQNNPNNINSSKRKKGKTKKGLKGKRGVYEVKGNESLESNSNSNNNLPLSQNLNSSSSLLQELSNHFGEVLQQTQTLSQTQTHTPLRADDSKSGEEAISNAKLNSDFDFFNIICTSIKIDLGLKYPAKAQMLFQINVRNLYESMKRDNIPFHRWHDSVLRVYQMSLNINQDEKKKSFWDIFK